MVDQVSAADARPTRLRALFDRIGALPDAALSGIDAAVSRAERYAPPVPGTTRTVSGAAIIERPDLVYEEAVRKHGSPEAAYRAALAEHGEEIRSAHGAQSRRIAPAAEVAPEGMSRR